MVMGMKSEIWKSTFREIRQSLGRFLAILAIVALGTGFFAGLKMTQPAMIKTTEQYLKENHFYDYRLLSTVGFSEEEVKKLWQQEDVWSVEGGVSFDILCGDNDKVLKAYSIPEEVNRLVLVEGRMPQKDTECVVDANLYDASSIGKKIVLSDANAESDLEHFTYREYTITGTVQSPLYIQFERGTSSLGNGRASGFFFLQPEGFAVDYYTEVYVKFAQNFPMYSDAYDAYMDEKQESWETLAQELSEERYTTVKRDAEKQLAEGKQELAEKKEDAGAELSDAKEQLDAAAEQIADGQEQLATAEQELAAAPEELTAREEELVKAEQEIAEKETELNQAEIAIGLAYAQGISQISGMMNGTSGNESGESGSTSGQSGSMAELSGSMAELFGGMSDLEHMSGEEIQAVLASVKQQISDGRAQLASAKQQISDGKAALAKARKELAEGEKELKEKKEELAEAEEEYRKGLEEYEEGLAEYEKAVAEAEEQIADGEQALADLEEPDSYVLGRETNVGYVCFESDSGIVDGIANVFPVFFFLVAALVCITTMSRMVEEQRTQIGVLKALGYGNGTVMAKYLFYSGSAAVTGCVLGFFVGTVFFPRVIWYVYGLMYRVDTLVYVFDWKLALICLAVSLACSMGTTWVCCRHELSQVAAELMRPKAPKAGKYVLLERIPFVWKRLKFLQKVAVRNIFRYKKRFFMMVLGISGCTALLVTGFGVRDSVTDIASQQYTQIQIYDIFVTCRNPVDAKLRQTMEETQGVEACALVMEKSVDLKVDGKQKSINLDVLDGTEDMSPFFNLHTTEGDTIAWPEKNEAVISHKIASDYDIRVGDTVSLVDEKQRELEVTIAGICENFVYNYIYISAETYEAQLGESPSYKNVLLNKTQEQDAHLLSTVLMNMDGVASVTVNQDTMERFAVMMRSMDLIVMVIILCAAGLAFIVLYNLTNINITERVREVATLKVLGFYENETASYVFRENTVLTLIGAGVGLVLGHFLHGFVMSQINIDMVTFDVHIQPVSFAYSVLLTLIFAWTVNQMMKKQIARISMTESLKSVD